jgi:hypothetical protein
MNETALGSPGLDRAEWEDAHEASLYPEVRAESPAFGRDQAAALQRGIAFLEKALDGQRFRAPGIASAGPFFARGKPGF